MSGLHSLNAIVRLQPFTVNTQAAELNNTSCPAQGDVIAIFNLQC
jgi:hypothetical protein